MIMSGLDSTLFTLDEVATIIWEAADGSTPLEEIVDSKICTQFKVERDEALRDAEALVEGLAGHRVFLPSSQRLTRSNLPRKAEGRAGSSQKLARKPPRLAFHPPIQYTSPIASTRAPLT